MNRFRHQHPNIFFVICTYAYPTFCLLCWPLSAVGREPGPGGVHPAAGGGGAGRHPGEGGQNAGQPPGPRHLGLSRSFFCLYRF
jgi:hypothetical protein